MQNSWDNFKKGNSDRCNALFQIHSMVTFDQEMCELIFIDCRKIFIDEPALINRFFINDDFVNLSAAVETMKQKDMFSDNIDNLTEILIHKSLRQFQYSFGIPKLLKKCKDLTEPNLITALNFYPSF